jgi:hypothetical protein
MSGMHPSKSWLLSCKTKNRIADNRLASRLHVSASVGNNVDGASSDQQAPLACDKHRFGTGFCAEPRQDCLDVMPDGFGRQE